MNDKPWLAGAIEVDGRPASASDSRAADPAADKPWLAGAVTVESRPLGERLSDGKGESARERAARRAEATRGNFDPSVSTGTYLWNEAKKTPGAIVGLVPDAVEWLGKKALGAPTDFGNVTQSIQRFMGADPRMRAPSQGVEDLGGLQTNVLGSLPFAGGALAAGRGGLGVLTELMSGLGGGVGEIVGKQGDGHLPQIIGQILGSAAGYRAGGVVEKTVPLVRQMTDAVMNQSAREAAILKARGLTENSPEFQAALAKRMEIAQRETISDLKKSFAQDDINALNAAFEQYRQIQSKFPGYKASVGEITGNDSALALQGKLESKNIPNLEERGARIRANEQALRDARENLIPEASGGIKSVMRGVQSSLDDDLRALNDKAAGYESELRAVSDRAAGSAAPVADVGSTLKGASAEGYAASKGRADQKFQAFRAALGNDAPAEVSNVTAKVKELQQKFTFDQQPEVIGLIQGVAKSPGTETVQRAADGWATIAQSPGMTIAQLDNLSSAANRDISRLKSAQNPDRKAIAQLQAIKDEARTAIEKTLTERGNTDALSKYREANRYFGEEHAPKYLTGVNMEVRLKNALNEDRIKPERVVDAYYKPGGTTEAVRFNSQFADNGPAKEALARGVLDRYKREVIDPSGGIINPQRHEAFMRKYAAANEQYPWIAKRLEKNAVAGQIAQRMEEQRALAGEIAESRLAQAVGTKDPAKFMEQALSDKRALFDTFSRLDQEGRRNFAIAVLNRGWDEAGKGSSGINKFLESNDNLRMLLRAGFGKEKADEQMNNLRLLARGLEITERAPKTNPMQAISEDTIKGATGTSPTQIFSALRAVGRRPGSEGWFLGVFGGQFVKAKIEANKDLILKQQLFDPDLLTATIQSARLPESAQSGFNMSARGKEAMSKLWDLTKMAAGSGAPTAAAVRVPAANRED